MKINVDFIYPIGSVYISTQPTDPSILFGGKWTQTAKSRAIVGAGSNIANTDTTYGTLAAGSLNLTAGVLLGVPTVTLQTSQIPAHEHSISWPSGTADTRYESNSISGSHSITIGGLGGTASAIPKATSTGGGGAHSNMMPAEVYYIWKRVS